MVLMRLRRLGGRQFRSEAQRGLTKLHEAEVLGLPQFLLFLPQMYAIRLYTIRPPKLPTVQEMTTVVHGPNS